MRLYPLVSGAKRVMPVEAIKFAYKVQSAECVAAFAVTLNGLTKGNHDFVVTGHFFTLRFLLYIITVISTHEIDQAYVDVRFVKVLAGKGFYFEGCGASD